MRAEVWNILDDYCCVKPMEKFPRKSLSFYNNLRTIVPWPCLRETQDDMRRLEIRTFPGGNMGGGEKGVNPSIYPQVGQQPLFTTR